MSECKTVDARNSFCPGPLMELISQMKQINIGDEIELLSTDAGTANDVPEWVNKAGHTHIGTEKEGDTWRVKVRKNK